MKNIIVVGYPKSGCTWATRLVAELVGCPVGGFWLSDKKEIAIEGKERISAFRCYKSHHQLAELRVEPNDPATRLVYILRDPRDIALSAANHFTFDRAPRLAALLRQARPLEKLYRHTLYPLLVRENYRLRRMTEALLHGSASVHNWVRVSWREHWLPYEKAGVPIVRYEDLLTQPEEEARRILRHLALERSDEEIANAIENQSFGRKKEVLLQSGETGRAKFLRVGKSGQWREKLPAELQARFTRELGADLTKWNYPLGLGE
ncbi:MAG: sulfotransferase domain-containing protein [Spartobacteria bacterium]